MGTWERTDSGDGEVASVSYGRVMLANTDVQGARCEGYDLYVDKSASSVHRHYAPTRRPPSEREPVATPSDRYAVVHHLQRAESAARSMVDAAEEREPMDVATFGIELKNQLRALWRLSHVRGDKWAGMLNFLQSSLAQLEFESFTPSHCCAVRDVIADYLIQSSVTDDDVYEANRVLRTAGLDPWRGLSPSRNAATGE